MRIRYGIDSEAASETVDLAPVASDSIVYEDGTEAAAVAMPQTQIVATASVSLVDRWRAAPSWLHAAAFIALGYAIAKW